MNSKKVMYWSGWVFSGLMTAMLVMSAVMKLTVNPMAVDGFVKFGYSKSVIVPLGITELLCLILYLIPQTSVLGAILLTGYLGGAIATHLRVEEVFAAPAILGCFVWLGLFLRDERIRALIPIRSRIKA